MTQPTTTFAPVPDARLAEHGTGPIPAYYYYDPAFFEAEREAIFKRTWLHIAHVCEVPDAGSFIVRPLEAARASILIVRGKDDRIRAFHNVCTHRGTLLVAAESGKAPKFSCRYHSWTYGHDGKLLAAPEIERFNIDKADCGLKEIKLDVCGGLIFINLAAEPEQNLQDFLGPIAGMLEGLTIAEATTYAEYVYEIDANWKLTYDNFQENYHIRFIHPRSIGAASLWPDNPYGYAKDFGFHGPHRTQSLAANPDFAPARVQGEAMGLLAQKAVEDGYGKALEDGLYLAPFPNFFLLGLPIQPFLHSVWPISAEKTRGVIRFYWKGDDADASERFSREFAMASARDIHSEDRAVIEAGQRGLSSGALEHIHFQSQEVLCRHFINAVCAAVARHAAGSQLPGVI